MVNELSMFEPLKFYYMCLPVMLVLIAQVEKSGHKIQKLNGIRTAIRASNGVFE